MKKFGLFLLALLVVFAAAFTAYRYFRKPVPPVVSDTDQLIQSISQAISLKHNLSPESYSVTVSENTGKFAKGLINPAQPGPGGGLWFAARVGGNWKLVWDGNGIITCDDLAAYPEFPSSLIPQCFDSSSETMLSR